MLTALAAFRADAGYVAVAAPESTLPVLEARLLEVGKRPAPQESGRRPPPRARGADGGGLGRAPAAAGSGCDRGGSRSRGCGCDRAGPRTERRNGRARARAAR